MATNEEYQNASKLTALTYMIAGCLGYSIENLFKYLDATHIYWAAFLVLLDRGGTDNLCDLRLRALVDKISPYKSLLRLPGMSLAYQMAFAQVSNAISKGEFSKEDFKNLLEVYEDGAKKTKG